MSSYTMLDHRFWGRYFDKEFFPQLTLILETLEVRLLPTFENVEAEAIAKAESLWQEAMNSTADPDVDEADIAEFVQDESAAFYLSLVAMKQAIINSFATFLYHAWEQQLFIFFRRQVLHPTEENDTALLELREVKKRIDAYGVNIQKLPSWKLINEARLLSNSIKHADGKSSGELKILRPDLFTDKAVATEMFQTPPGRVYAPLAGEDIYVSVEDLRLYRDAMINFWKEFCEAISVENLDAH